MAKVSGSIQSLLYGVSEQPPHRRLDGQHGKVTNFVPNIVHGLVRRAGSTFLSLAETHTNVDKYPTNSLDAKYWGSYDFNLGGTQYTVFYRRAPVVDSNLPAMCVFNQTTGQFVESEGVGYPDLGLADAAGYSCCTQVGKFLVFGINNFTPTFRKEDLTSTKVLPDLSTRYNVGNWGNVVWIKSGLYGKEYKLRITSDIIDGVTGEVIATSWITTFSYTTPKAQYDGVLDTSSIPITDPEYQKKVNDATHAYNTAVNQHIATASKAILPENIATALGNLIRANGFPTTAMVNVQGEYINIAHLQPVNGTGFASNWMYRLTIDPEVSGASSEAMVVLTQEVDSTDKLTAKAPIGKVVKVSPSQGTSYYLMAYPKGSTFKLGIDDLPTTEGFRDPLRRDRYVFSSVVWKECPEELLIPDKVMVIATIGNNGKFYWGTSTDLLTGVCGFEVPRFAPNKAGSKDVFKLPLALTVPINFMTTIQGRLVVCGGGGILLSRSKDFFDFFPKSAITVLDDDPIDATVNGAEGDNLHSGIPLGRDLLLFGTTKQYAVLGNQLITPKAFTVVTQDAVSLNKQCPPIVMDNQVVFSKFDNGNSSINAIAFGDFEGMYRTVPLSQQLTTFIKGYATAATYVPEAGMLFLRTDTRTNSIVVMTLLSTGDTKVPSWCEWSWSTDLGTLVGMSSYNGKLRALYLRKLANNTLGFIMDEFSLNYTDSLLPLLDSKRTVTTAMSLGTTADLVGRVITVSNTEDTYLHSVPWETGRPFNSDADNHYLGYTFTSSLALTSLFIRDGKGVSILDGRTVTTSVLLHLKETTALQAYVEAFGELALVKDHHYRNANGNFLTVKEAVGSGVVSIPIGREVKEYVLHIDSVSWYPLTLTSLEWQGHLFTNRR